MSRRSEHAVDFEGGLFSFSNRNGIEPEIIVEPAPGECGDLTLTLTLLL